MTQPTRPAILERIQKLLAKTTGNGATEAEAQTALAMAQELMDAHNIAMADLTTAGPAATLFGEHTAHSAASIPRHYVACLSIVEEVLAVRTVVKRFASQSSTGRAKTERIDICIFGDPVNVLSATWA